MGPHRFLPRAADAWSGHGGTLVTSVRRRGRIPRICARPLVDCYQYLLLDGVTLKVKGGCWSEETPGALRLRHCPKGAAGTRELPLGLLRKRGPSGRYPLSPLHRRSHGYRPLATWALRVSPFRRRCLRETLRLAR